MGYFRPDQLRDGEVAQARRDARAVLTVVRARLRAGEPVDAQALGDLAEDERLTPRLRVRAAEYLGRAWGQALTAVAGRLPRSGPKRP